MSGVLAEQGKLLESKKLSEQSLELRIERLSAYHGDIAASLCALARNYSALGVYDKALTLFKRALRVSRESFKTVNNLQIASIIVGIAEVLRSLRYIDASEKMHTIANNIRLQLLDRNHPAVAASIFYLNCVSYLKGEQQRANIY